MLMDQRLLSVTLLLLSFTGCKQTETGVAHNQPEDTAAVHAFSVGAAWDIYDGGQYRYGPSIIRNADNSIDVWFAAPGGNFGERVLHYRDAPEQSPVSLKGPSTAAQKFAAAAPFYGVAVVCPNWNSTNSSLTFSLYRWHTDYATTLQGPPLASAAFENYQDNQHLVLTKKEKFGPGDYLWVLSKPSGTAGTWRREAAMPGVINYLDGKETTGSYFSYQLLEESSGGIFWDQCAYRRTRDGGKTWTADEMVLLPTEGSRDAFSICDPGVVRFGGYYYLGYTSTQDSRQIFNHVYVARAQSPKGPWLKWDGTGWSDKPQPIITFTGHADAWGAGEPSLVVNNDTLFLYYTWHDKEVLETRVATASTQDSHWPGQLTYRGVAIDKTSIKGADHCDVKFRDDIKRYQAIHTASRFTKDSHIVLWESADGIRFRKKAEIRDNLKPFLHNCGWSGDEKGHIDPAKQQYLSYAYGTDWGNWKTAWSPITFDK
jgi:hypothetical protein